MKSILRLFVLVAAFCATQAVAKSPIRPGDRVAIVGNTFADQLRIHGYLETVLFQSSKVSIRNLGWGGDMLAARDRPTGFPSEESSLMEHKTDVIIACFGMGESFGGEEGIKNFKADLQSFISSHAGKKYNGKSDVRLILVSPIAYEDLGKRTPARERRNRELQAYSHAMRDVAGSARLPFVDLFETSRYVMDEKEGPNLTTNGIHLNSFGYWAISHAFLDQLTGEPRKRWVLRIDAKSKTGRAEGVELSRISPDQKGVSFKVEESSAPSLRPPGEGGVDLPPQLAGRRDTLIVTNLAPGSYTLIVDDQEVVTAKHDAWERGIAIDSTPSHLKLEELRSAINDKNLQFTYSWKALNQVHIVGERRKSPSGRALPKEIIEFNTLANKREADLKGHLQGKVRQWHLVPAKQ